MHRHVFRPSQDSSVSLGLTYKNIYKYINFHDHQNIAVKKIVDTGSPVMTEMDGKLISERGYRPCFNRFLLNVQCLYERSQQ